MKNWFFITLIFMISSCEYFLFTSKMRNNFYQKKYNKLWEDNNINISIGPLFDSTDFIKIYQNDSLVFKGKCLKSLDIFSEDIYTKSIKEELHFLVILNDSIKVETKVIRNIQNERLRIIIVKIDNILHILHED